MVEIQHFSKTTDFQEAMNKFPHLRAYVNKVSRAEGIPEFKTTLDKSMRELNAPNIIYPVGDPIFIHLSKGPNTNEPVQYKPVIPELTEDEKKLYDLILTRIIEIAHTAKIPKTYEEQKNVLLNLYNDIVEIKDKEEKPSFLHLFGKKIGLTEVQYHNLSFHMIKNRLGYGPLEPILRDVFIEDVHCVGVGHIWLIHKVFGSIETSVVFENDIELNKYLVETTERVERPVSEAKPVVDAIMPDGSRGNFIYSRKISLGGSSFTIRKFNETPISVPMLINWGTWSSMMGAYLWLCCENEISIFVCGETASGKTTTLNAMTAFIPFNNKVYTVENTPEVTLPHPIWQHLVTRESGEKTDVTMFELLIAALRSRPDYIIVGEIRGVEANVTFQAMQTGHPCMSTFHAGSVHSMIQRLTGDPINVPISFIDVLNVALIQSAVYVKGRVERRVLSITEIIRYNDEAGKVLTKEVFHWDPTTDVHQFRGLYNSFIMEDKIASHLGLQDPREIYSIMDKRAKILKGLIDNKIMDYFKCVKLFKEFRNVGDTSLPFKI